MNHLVMITENEDGVIDESDLRWCATWTVDTARTLCGEPMDDASHWKAEYKAVKRGGITCSICRNAIKEIKSYKL